MYDANIEYSQWGLANGVRLSTSVGEYTVLHLFADEAIEILAAHARGNRRNIMNIATMALEEAYYRQEKTITAETLYEAEWFNESE